MIEDTKKADDVTEKPQSLGEMIEAHAARLRDEQDKMKARILAAGYTSDQICMLSTMQHICADPAMNPMMNLLGHMGDCHDDLEAAEVFSALSALMSRYSLALEEASRASGVDLGKRDPDIAASNKKTADAIIAKIKAKHANAH